MRKGRALLLTLLVIVAVVGAIHFAGSGEEPAMPEQFVDEDVVEVAPIVPAARLGGASWRTAEQVREDRIAEDARSDAGESVLDKVEWSENEIGRAYEKSVQEAVKEIDGLGVYVAPPEAAGEKRAK